jgi:2-methylcitrate dehydratase
VVDLLLKHPQVLSDTSRIAEIAITAYEPAFGIIGDPAKRSPKTRQSADHSMVFIVSRFIQRAKSAAESGIFPKNSDEAWKAWMLAPADYGSEALQDADTRRLMEKISFIHGGIDYDTRYPDGIPTSLEMKLHDGTKLVQPQPSHSQ